MRQIATRVATVILCGIAATAFAAEREYEIRFHRPTRVGARHHLVKSMTIHYRMTRSGGGEKPEPWESTVRYELDAIAECSKIDDHGNAVQMKITIDRFDTTQDGVEHQVLAKGLKVIADAGKSQTTFALEKWQLTDEQRLALRHMIELDSQDHLDDGVFGPGGPQKPGAMWNLNAVKYAEKLRLQGYTVRAEDVTGTVKFLNTESAEGMQWLNLRVETKLANFVTADDPVPPGGQRKSLSMDGEVGWTYGIPVDVSTVAWQVKAMASKMHAKVEYTFAGREYKEDWAIEDTREGTIVPVGN